ncbi:PIN domain-like protein [Gloeophyllum trabeum ATCC 11539]|uniref:PIN domain-like protein n=1 Tax=Gloeophyllum trabeum (strain ATCC 11539 / FP-39264 / Madison 617) TaxID=670483 RepID=S7PQK5_GLOTA|nr:PIN domain-like protein [Gloeophyllum trabeum ATCC 11539]EPQ50091.1 PIN domain-like protein [Gloeophyllum trabeum ATCC 11539]
MGVKGLWPYLSPAEQTEDMTLLTVRHSQAHPGHIQPFRVGVDTSIWLHATQNAMAVGHAQSGENPELQALFRKTARLFSLCTSAVFVFDGDERPALKRNTKVIHYEHWLAAGLRELITCFGFVWCILDTETDPDKAPAEAEAQLAAMQQQGLIDAVITDDSDVFVFGAKTVIRTPNVKKDKENVRMYCDTRIHAAINPAMTQGGFLLTALLSGGDYDLVGRDQIFWLCYCSRSCKIRFRGCLPRDSSPPVAEHLVAFETLRAEMKMCLRHDPLHYLGRRSAVLADAIPDSFPNHATFLAYTRPRIDENAMLAKLCTTVTFPNLERLGRLCERSFSWGTREGILAAFRAQVWPGLVRRSLWAQASDNPIKFTLLPSSLLPRRFKQAGGLRFCQVRVAVEALMEDTVASLTDERAGRHQARARTSAKRPRVASSTDPLDIWVPAVVIDMIHPSDCGHGAGTVLHSRLRDSLHDATEGLSANTPIDIDAICDNALPAPSPVIVDDELESCEGGLGPHIIGDGSSCLPYDLTGSGRCSPYIRALSDDEDLPSVSELIASVWGPLL